MFVLSAASCELEASSLWFLTGPFHWDSYWNLWNSSVFPSSSVLLVMKLSRHTKKTLHAWLWQQLISTSVYFLLLVENKISFSACSCSCVNLTAFIYIRNSTALFLCYKFSQKKGFRSLVHACRTFVSMICVFLRYHISHRELKVVLLSQISLEN